MTEAYNPLDIENLGESIANAILGAEAIPLAEIPRFKGAGLYSLYYCGDFPYYAALAAANAGQSLTTPIYIGKATPAGGRKGVDLLNGTGTPLYSRIQEHRRSIEESDNLDSADFFVRWLVVESIWIPLGESTLLRHFKPLWNAEIDGFGNHAPGKGRDKSARSKWDILHPGRAWAARLAPPTQTIDEIGEIAAAYLLSTSAEGDTTDTHHGKSRVIVRGMEGTVDFDSGEHHDSRAASGGVALPASSNLDDPSPNPSKRPPSASPNPAGTTPR